MYQHLFWFFGHPEVYINFTSLWNVSVIIQLMLINHIRIFRNGLRHVIYRYFRLYVWAHHMYTVGLDVDTSLFYSATMIIAVPTVLKSLVASYFVWILLKIEDFLIICTRLLLLFTIGGLSGVVS